MSEHFIERCVCGTIISQCRCPGDKVERTSKAVCVHVQSAPPAMTDHAQREETHEEFAVRMAAYRGVERNAMCPECNATGVKMYSSTAVWRGGIGGQSITSAACDHCWGSGDKFRPWTDLRKMDQRSTQATLAAREAELNTLAQSHDAMLIRLGEAEKDLYTAIHDHGGDNGMWGKWCARLLDKRDAAVQEAGRLKEALRAILHADERGQGLPFKEAMERAFTLVRGKDDIA